MRTGGGSAVVWAAAVLFLSGCGGGGGGHVQPSSPHIVLQSFSQADVVFGQAVFALALPNRGLSEPSGATLSSPGMPNADPLFIPDAENHRVLGFHAQPIISNLAANFVLGQPGLDYAFPGVGATAMREPSCAHVYQGDLFVSDTGNNRVLVWRPLPQTSTAPPDLVLGQPGFEAREPSAGPLGMSAPAGMCGTGDCLLVVDRGNHRVLIWCNQPVVDATPADFVLGQPDFDAAEPNRGGAPAAGTLLDPCAVWSDGSRVVVVDRGNHRVLIWNSMPRVNGQPADIVLGQPDFATAEPGLGLLRLSSPSDLACDGTRLLVADAGNHRVLVWDAFPGAGGAPPDRVFGQSGFDHGVPNDDDQDGVEDSVPTARTLKSKDGFLGVALSTDAICISDRGNHRLLLFRGN